MLIKNLQQLATTPQRAKALQIISAGIERALPQNIIDQSITYDASGKILRADGDVYNHAQGRLFVIGGGKAAGLMAEALEKVIGPDNITAGVVTCHNSGAHTEKIKIIKASHPIPDQTGVTGAKEMLGLKDRYNINEKDLIICLISGGGSALMAYPVVGVGLEDLQKTTQLLLRSGAAINEVNLVRKHLSRVKGGQLGQFFASTPVVSLIISDVVGNDLSAIASGPTVPDPSTFADAYQVLGKYNLLKLVPSPVANYLDKGRLGSKPETPNKLTNCFNYIVGDNRLALQAMKTKAQNLGLKPLIVSSEEQGDPDKITQQRAQEIINGDYRQYNVLIMGGEPTPALPKSPGEGGRNQYYAAAALLAMKGYKHKWTVASVATDGSDFMPEVAGGIVDSASLTDQGITNQTVQTHLSEFDSYNLLKKLDNSLIKTGQTGTNVGDIMLYVLGS